MAVRQWVGLWKSQICVLNHCDINGIFRVEATHSCNHEFQALLLFLPEVEDATLKRMLEHQHSVHIFSEEDTYLTGLYLYLSKVTRQDLEPFNLRLKVAALK